MDSVVIMFRKMVVLSNGTLADTKNAIVNAKEKVQSKSDSYKSKNSKDAH